MRRFAVGQHAFDETNPALEAALVQAREQKIRPLCLCRSPGVAMYIARDEGRLLIKRMPGSGEFHAPECDSYEPPAELSGLGQVLGSAIREDAETGTVAIKLGFSLTKIGGRAAPVPSGSSSDSVSADATKLSLRGTLHYLWDQAGLTRWVPAMAGKRNWAVIRKYVLQAAGDKITKGGSLSDSLYIPEPWSTSRADQIAAQRQAMLTGLAASADGRKRRLMLVIGELKEILPARFGFKVLLRHVPDGPFMISAQLHERMLRRFELELGLWDAHADSHLVAIATFSVGPTGLPSIEEIALVNTTSDWIPFESEFEKQLVDAMARAGRRFVKGLRYNLSGAEPLASLVASDTSPATAMYIEPPASDERFTGRQQELVDGSALASWIWRPGAGAMPPLPERLVQSTPAAAPRAAVPARP